MSARVQLPIIAAFAVGIGSAAAAQNAGPRGDVNGDGQITAIDAQAVLSAVVGAPLPVTFSVSSWGDANCSGAVQAVDAQIILSRVVGMDVSAQCVGQPLARVVTIEVGAPTQNLAIGGAAALAVVLKDSAGSVLTDRDVRFASSDPAKAAVDVEGDVSGVAAGAAVITVHSERRSSTLSFNVADAAGAITLLAGDGQIGFGGRPLFDSIRVKVTDGTGVPVPDQQLVVTAVSGGGSTPGAVTTNADGIAQFQYLPVAAGENIFTVNTVDGPPQLALRLRAYATPTAQRIVTVAVSSCFLGADGLTRCWGNNTLGTLGTTTLAAAEFGAAAISSVPVTIDGGLQFRSLFSSPANSIFVGPVCGLTAADQAYCWGSNIDNWLDVAATETCATTTGFGVLHCIRSPQPVGGALRFAILGLGYNRGSRICGITVNGELYCWGENSGGSLGNGTFGHSSTPTRIADTLGKFVDVGSSLRHTCALTALGKVYCWGANFSGVLGYATPTDSVASPRLVEGLPKAVALSVSGVGACALAESGALWCWGGNRPVGTPIGRPALIGGTSFLSGDAGDLGFCGIGRDALTYCYVTASGATNGAAGNGTTTTSSVPVLVSGGNQFSQISSGLWHVCAMTTVADVYCWGNSTFGETGVRASGPVSRPLKVLFGARPTESAANMIAMSASERTWATGASLSEFFAVRVTGPSGFGVQGASVTFTVVSGGGWFNNATDTVRIVTTDSSGVARVNPLWRLGPASGNNYLVVKTAGVTDTVAFLAKGVTPGAPATLTGSSISPQAASTTFSSTAVVRDGNGLPVPGVAVHFSAPSADIGTLSPALPATINTDADGVARVQITVAGRIAKRDSIVVTSAGLTSVKNFVNIVATTLSRIAFSTQPVNAAPGAAINPAVRVTLQDQYGNTVLSTGQTVTLALGGSSPAGVTLQGAPVSATTTLGVATFSDVRVPAVGSGYQLVATNSTRTTTSVPFDVVLPAGSTLAVSQQPESFKDVDTPVATLPSVLLRDASNVPIQGVTVRFTVVSGGGTLSGANAVTDASGIATPAGWTLGPAPGMNTIRASVAGAAPVDFDVDARWARRLAAGVAHTCALTAVGAVYCWGDGAFQSLGPGTPASSSAPVAAAMPDLSKLFPSITQGLCGLESVANVFTCWGRNDNGNGNAPGPISGGINFTEVTLGRILSCGVDNVGVGYCWGLNQQGGVGRVADAFGVNRTNPLPVDGGLTFKSVVAGWQHACGLTPDGSAYCWGLGTSGQLGLGTFASTRSPQAVATSEKFTQLSLGALYSCGLTIARRVFCWGANGTGQLGDGTTTNRGVPTPIARELKFSSVDVTSHISNAVNGVQGFAASTCAVTDDGQAFCWGWNAMGQLGDGTTTDRLVPTRVDTDLRFTSVDVGEMFACGMRGNAVWCWGDNTLGRLGDGTTTQRLRPVRVQAPF